jgi:hypothetical protein
MTYKRKPVYERMLAKTKIPIKPNGTVDYDQCWEWSGATNNAGYGLIRQSPEDGMKLVHHVSAIYNNVQKTGIEYQHTCLNKLCVNPNHLTSGMPVDRYNRMVVLKGFWTHNDNWYKKCEHCGVTTYQNWFKRKHMNCGAN